MGDCLIHRSILSNIIPSTYTGVEYLESSGTQYINTGILCDQIGRIECKFMYTSNTTSGGNFAYLYGAELSSDPWNSFFVRMHKSGSTYTFENTAFGSQLEYSFATNTMYTWSQMINQDKSWSGKLNTTVKSTTGTLNNANKNLYLFCDNNGDVAQRFSISRIYYLIIFGLDQRTILGKLLPVRRNSNSTLGFYDITRKSFLTNQGTGTFTSGNDVFFQPLPIIT